MFSALSSKIAAGIGAVLIFTLIGFGFYYKTSQNRIEALTTDNATLKSNQVRLQGTVTTLNTSIDTLTKQREQDQKTILEISNRYAKAEQQVQEMKDTFARHNLEKLSLAKPGLIERIINSGTAKEGKQFIELTTHNEIADAIEEATQ